MISFPVWFAACLEAMDLALCLLVGAVFFVVARVVLAAIDAGYTAMPPRPPAPPKNPAAAVPVSVPAAGTAPTRIDRRAASR